MISHKRKVIFGTALVVACAWIVTSSVALSSRAHAPASLGDDPLVTEEESRFLSHIRQVTHGFQRAGEGYFSPDGQRIIFQAVPQDYPFYQIYTQRLDEGEPHLVSTGRGRTTCGYFHPNGRKIIFASSHQDPNLDETEAAGREKAKNPGRRYEWVFDPHMDIFEANLDGTGLRPLTSEMGYDAEGSYSPDGEQIVFTSDRDGDPDLYIMNADGTGARQLTDAPGYDGGPFFSPDGRWIIFRSDREKKDMLQIYVIGADGRNERALTDDLGTVNWAPYWYKDSRHIIWARADYSQFPEVRPNFDLFLMKLEEAGGALGPGPLTRITDHRSADVLPVFSPDGKRLMWTSNRTDDGSSHLFLADLVLENFPPLNGR